MKIKLTVSYDGTDFCGWQVQPTGVSVQEVLQNAVKTLTGEDAKVTGSGRTDAGVHAEGQVAHFSVEKSTVPPEKFAKALNTLLPSSVKVLNSQRVDENFDARKSAKQKTYRYSFYVSEVELPLKERFFTRLDRLPDLEKIRQGAKKFIGEHDFACFNASGGGAKTTVRSVYDIKVNQLENQIYFLVTGNGFLYNMVRTMVGTLLEVGYGKKQLSDLETMLKNKDRTMVGKTLPAKGLCLYTVEYE